MEFRDKGREDKKEKKLKIFEEMSIEALSEHIEELQAEIFQIERMIIDKKKALEGANKFFKG